MNCNTIMCESGYRCYEGDVAGRPYCASTSTCDNVRCQSGYGCQEDVDGPICVKQDQGIVFYPFSCPPISYLPEFVLSCANIACASFHSCEDDSIGVGVCSPFTGPCDSSYVSPNPPCLSNIQIFILSVIVGRRTSAGIAQFLLAAPATVSGTENASGRGLYAPRKSPLPIRRLDSTVRSRNGLNGVAVCRARRWVMRPERDK